jgi:Co/Zn/Cd efflux system component
MVRQGGTQDSSMAKDTCHQKTGCNTHTMETLPGLPGSDVSTSSQGSYSSGSNVSLLAEMSVDGGDLELGYPSSFSVDASDVQADVANAKTQPKKRRLQQGFRRSFLDRRIQVQSTCQLDQKETCQRQCSSNSGSKGNHAFAAGAGGCVTTEQQCSTSLADSDVEDPFQTVPKDHASGVAQQPACREGIAEFVANSTFLTPSVPDKIVRWLRFLFFATLALLVFQVLLGWMARAVTLIADSGHTATDAVAYGLNAIVEWLKLRSTRSSRNVASSNLPAVAISIDTAGSVLSLLLLMVAIWFAIVEAWERLQTPSGDDFEHIGSALATFAVVSSAMNFGLLIMYRRLQLQAPLVQQVQEEDKPELEDPAGKAFDDEMKSLEYCPSCVSPDVGFSGCTIAPAMAVMTEAKDNRSRPSNDCAASSQEASVNYLQTLHEWVHIGCNCAGFESICGRPDNDRQNEDALDRDLTISEVAAVSTKDENLNLLSALLHLITDLLRSILILGASIMIHIVGGQHAEQIDAISALVVAFLIFVGSLALFLKVSARICQRAYTEKHRSTSGGQASSALLEYGTLK